MKKNLYRLIILALIFCLTEVSYAGAARPDTVVFTQPDGSKISITLKGNENIHWAVTPDGYTAVFDKKGFYVYAIHDKDGNLVPSGIVVHDPGSRTNEETAFISKIQKGLYFSKQQTTVSSSRQKSTVTAKKAESSIFPSKGTNNLVCILVSFQDVACVKTASDISALFNTPGYSYDGAQGSVRDYYKAVSYNKLDLNTDVYGPYTVSHNRAYYGSSTGAGTTNDMVVEAIHLADGEIDYTKYDNDGDGKVEGVFIIFAGLGEEAGGPEEAVWSRSGGITDTCRHDGCSFYQYACTGELRDLSNNINRIGMICHELGHMLGAGDFYDGGGAIKYQGTGYWDLMGDGEWNNGGITPAPPNAYNRTKTFKWATATLLNKAQKGVVLNNSAENPAFYYFETPMLDEYFLLENKSKIGFDSYIPGEGLLIYHKARYLDTTGRPVNEMHPQNFYPVCASAGMNPTDDPTSYGTINDSLCPYTGNYGSDEFSPFTLPSTRTWAGDYPYGQLTNINYNKSSQIVTFDFSGIKVNMITINARGTQGTEHINLLIDGSAIDTGWTLTTSYEEYTAAVFTDGDIRVQFDNDSSGSDVQVDYILVNGEKRQAENMQYNTGAYANGRCGGGSYSEWLHCNGVIGFGKTTENFGENTIVIRAGGVLGGEHINLLINGVVNTSWNLPIYLQELKAKVNGDGDINVQFDNDSSGRDVRIDWIQVNDQLPRQAENMQYNTGVYVNGRCGGGEYSEWLHCNGVIGFGKISDDFGVIPGSGGDCSFSVPMTSALPSLNKQYNYMHVIGSTSTLSNVNKFTINWSLENNGLWDISYNTSNGSPNWYVSLMGKVTQTFASASPSMTISGSGISILDGNYWVTMDGDNFVMVDKSNNYAIYCSNSATSPCSNLKSGNVVTARQSEPPFRFYPNPSMGSITIESDNFNPDDRIRIYDLTGKILYSKDNITEDKIYISGLERGVYIINIKSNEYEYNEKLVVY